MTGLGYNAYRDGAADDAESSLFMYLGQYVDGALTGK